MRNNCMRFGNLAVLQLLGIAMGIAPAPTIANLFVALHKEAEILRWLKICVYYLCRFINDGFGIWIHHPDPATDAELWQEFQAAVNNGGLRWEFTRRSRSVNFMDVTIYIGNDRLETDLYEKKLALHLYIPPHSCHAPGVLTGL
ncbi:hypothetical protein ACHAWF_000202, partial [Thalassiosira exigua]